MTYLIIISLLIALVFTVYFVSNSAIKESKNASYRFAEMESYSKLKNGKYSVNKFNNPAVIFAIGDIQVSIIRWIAKVDKVIELKFFVNDDRWNVLNSKTIKTIKNENIVNNYNKLLSFTPSNSISTLSINKNSAYLEFDDWSDNEQIQFQEKMDKIIGVFLLICKEQQKNLQIILK
ncbi:MAG: hypothetical protein JXR68_08875 [Bacteroidales bacterium]|nr:hypothetical protein [Bacteroidales bacterium]